jgi:DNA (cytosine-5)-methyltransferase 1
MHTAKIVSIKEHRGSPRVWFQGKAPERSGFKPGCRFTVRPHPDRPKEGVVIRLCAEGERIVSRKVYASGTEVPVLDLNSSKDLEIFEGCESVRVVFGEGCVYLSPVATEQRRVKRLTRLRTRLQAGEALTTAGVCAGGGVLSHAVHAGFNDAGVKTRLAMHNEIRDDLAEQVAEHNDIFDEQSVLLQMPLQELAFDDAVLRRLGEVDVMELGLPCSGASVAGRAKRSLGMPEEHPDVGHLVVAALALIAKLNPVACIFENVPQYANTASAVLIRQQLRDFGYDTHEIEVFGPDFGELEARKRWCLAAVTKGIPFDFQTLVVGPFAVRTLSDVLEPAKAVADEWSPMTGLKDKAQRDKEAGNGFKMQVYTGTENQIHTLTKGLVKNRSTDPKIQHPDNPELLRVPTVGEHARCKGVPEHLVQGLSKTTAHELLGQGIVYRPFRLVARHLALALKRFALEQTNSFSESRVAALRAAA